MAGAEELGASYQGLALDEGKEVLTNVDNVSLDNITFQATSSGEFKKGLALKNGGAGDVRIPYLNSDTIGEISGEIILGEQVNFESTSGGKKAVKGITAGNVNATLIKDRDGNVIDADFKNHRDMRNVRFVETS